MSSRMSLPLPDSALIARYDQRVPRYTSYPTAVSFTDAIDASIYADWLESLPDDETLSLYLHVPFCAELCFYCGCHTTVARRYTPIAAYVALVEQEIALVSRHLGNGRRVAHVHWGGGTPTILAPDDFRRLMNVLARHFDLLPDAEIAIEIDPRTLTRERVDALAEAGVNRASLGVQDFDPVVQRAVNRVQPYEQTAQTVTWLRDAGIASISMDLMYGLPHQTVDSVEKSVAAATGLDPDRIALFGYAHVPWMKRNQALMPEDALPDSTERLAQSRAATDSLVAAGYVAIGLDHFARPGDLLARSQGTGTLHRNFQGYTTDQAATLIGFGTSSIGRLPQGFVQNASSTVDYRAAVTDGRLATARGVAIAPEDRLRGEIIERLMCDLAVDLERVVPDHGRAPEDFLPELARIDAMAEDGVVSRDGFRIAVPPEARPFLRSVCAVFDSHLSRSASRHSRAL